MINGVHVHNAHEDVTSQSKHNFLQLCSSHILKPYLWGISSEVCLGFLRLTSFIHTAKERVRFSRGGQHKMLDIKSGHQHTNCSKRKLKSARISSILSLLISIYIWSVFFARLGQKSCPLSVASWLPTFPAAGEDFPIWSPPDRLQGSHPAIQCSPMGPMNRSNTTRWCPQDSVQLVQITPITLVFIGDISIVNGLINQLITGGHHLVKQGF